MTMTYLTITITVLGVALVSIWAGLSAVAMMRRGFLEDFEPEFDGPAQLFEEDLETVLAAFRKEVDENADMRISQTARSQMLVELHPSRGPLAAVCSISARLRFADVGCGTEVCCAYVRKLRWGPVDTARLASRMDTRLGRAVVRHGITRIL